MNNFSSQKKQQSSTKRTSSQRHSDSAKESSRRANPSKFSSQKKGTSRPPHGSSSKIGDKKNYKPKNKTSFSKQEKSTTSQHTTHSSKSQYKPFLKQSTKYESNKHESTKHTNKDNYKLKSRGSFTKQTITQTNTSTSPRFLESLSQILKFPNIYSLKKGKQVRFLVKTLDKKSYFDETILSIQSELYREVDPKRSKLFAGIAKGLSQIGFTNESSVLYLGASHGYTVSFLSDVVSNGTIYALDFAPRVLRDLVFYVNKKQILHQ